MTQTASAPRIRSVALVGNPNCGKTTLFNRLTGLRQKVGNYPGVTVEKKEGIIRFADGSIAEMLDLPGTYSLIPHSPDESIATDILLGRYKNENPDLVVCVVDASNLERHLYLVTQIIDRQLPLVIALNMVDIAEENGVNINKEILTKRLGVPVVPVVASKGIGIDNLKRVIAEANHPVGQGRQWKLPSLVDQELNELMGLLADHHQLSAPIAFHESVLLLSSGNGSPTNGNRYSQQVLRHLQQDHNRLDAAGIDRQSVFVESRFQLVREICASAVEKKESGKPTISDRIDHFATHKVWGFIIFLIFMGLMFQAMFSWSEIPMLAISNGFDWIGLQVTRVLPAGPLQDLIVNGAFAGVAAVVTFLPQILFLFFFLGILEDTGYMARAAFIMDRLMGKVGLSGKSFIPLLSSFACAIPGIMATRTIDNPRDRLVTMLVAPLMSCSARLPVYTLMIAAFIPGITLFGFLSLAGLTLLSMYLLGLLAALGTAWVFKKTLAKGTPSFFIMELPQYRLPSVQSIGRQMFDRSWQFVKRAGTFILGVSIVLWFLASYPRTENATPAEQLQQSFAGQAGKIIEPVIKPLGFDWKIGIGLIGSLLQREVFVSTMGTIYNIQDAGDGSVSLQQKIRDERDPETGKPSFTLLTAICVMVYYVFAMQCFSTVAIMRKETGGWKWPVFQFAYMTTLAWLFTFGVYRVGLLLGGA